jgi:hypothetical protein
VTGNQRAVVAAAAMLLWAPSAQAQGFTASPIPDGLQWTGFTCMDVPGCACPVDASASFRATHCTAGGKIPFGNPLFTLIWGTGQPNLGGSSLTAIPKEAGPCARRASPVGIVVASSPSWP